jgi:hypothetical protein
MFEDGERCVCTEDEWYNAYGDKSTALARGMRLTVSGRRRVGGCLFLSFEETPEDNFFLCHGFKPMRTLH